MNEIKNEYYELLESGMFWEFFPEYTGKWSEDESKFILFYLDRQAWLDNPLLKP